MPTVHHRSTRRGRASAVAALTAVVLVVAAAPAAFAQTPGNTQRYQGPGTISGNIPTLPASIPGQLAVGFDLGTAPTVFSFEIQASAADQTVVFSAPSLRNVQIDGNSPPFDFAFEAKLETTVVVAGNPINAETDGRISFTGSINADGTGQIESQGPPVPVIVNGNPVGEITNILADLSVSCADTLTLRCLSNGRFAVQVDWGTREGTGMANVVPFGSSDSALFWFFQPDNWEMLLKVLDNCDFNNHFWVFAAATTNVEYTITIIDTANGTQTQYFNPLDNNAPAITDIEAFATCP